MTRNTGPTKKDKTWSMVLATTTCLGIAGTLGYRMAQETPQPEPEPVLVAAVPEQATTSSGYTKEQLDAYAALLQEEADRLANYRASLVAAAGELQTLINQQAEQGNQLPTQVKNKTPKPLNNTQQPQVQVQQSQAQPQQTQPQAAVTSTKPKPKPAPAPEIVPAQQAPTVQTNTKSS